MSEQAAPVTAASTEAAATETETAAEGEESSDQAQPEAGQESLDAKREEVKSQLRKLKYKVDGEEIEEEIDLANEAELIKMVQMAKMAQKRAAEAAELKKNEMRTRKDIQDFMNLIQKDPRAIMAKLGVNEKQLAEQIMNEELERSQMDPKELENLELKKQLQEVLKKQEDEKIRIAEIERERMREKYAGEYEKELMEAIKENGLPENPEYVMRAVNLLKIANEAGISMNFKDVMPFVKEQVLENMKALMPQFDLDTIERLVNEDRISELYKRKRAKSPAKDAKKTAPPTANSIVDTGTAKKVEDLDKPKFKSIDPNKFWKNL